MTDIVNRLPEDVVYLIWTYVRPVNMVGLNRTLYHQHHFGLRKCIPKFENYVRDTVQRDNEFVFEKIVEENIHEWLKSRTYYYKGILFNNYIYFMNYFCIEHDSEQCRQIINRHLVNRNLRRNLHKKNIVKYISNHTTKWTN
jgi:hypothetical protein